MGYHGSKAASGLYQAIINIMPPHDVYIEPFLGSGQILRRKSPSQTSIGFDLDKDLIDKSDYAGLDVDIRCGDGLEFISNYSFVGDELIYCDPPYPHCTRSSKRYQFDWVDSSHIHLCQLVNNLNTRIIMSSYPNFIYDEYLSGWNTFTLQVMTRGGVRTEQVWYNYDLDKVHYHKYAGKNFTDRQRIQRKASRWANRYQRLPPGERQAVLAAILNTDSDLV